MFLKLLQNFSQSLNNGMDWYYIGSFKCFFFQNVSKTKKDSFTSGTNKLASLKKNFSKEMKKNVFDAGTNEYP